MSTLKTAYRKTLLATLIGFSMGVGPVWAADADPDRGFGNEEIYSPGSLYGIDLGGSDDYAASFGLVDNDDNMLAVGQRYDGEAGGYPVMARFNVDGLPDETYWVDGFTELPDYNFIDTLLATLVQKDGKILALDRDFRVYRFLPDGTIDEDFGLKGIAAVELSNATSSAFALHEDGSILVAGISDDKISQDPDLTVVRYKNDGLADMSFGSKGVYILRKKLTDSVRAVVIPRSGARILAGGSANGRPIVWSINGNGSGATNFAMVSDKVFRGEVADLAIQPDDKVVALVQGQKGTLEGLYPLRYLASGAIDAKLAVKVSDFEIPDVDPPLPARVLIQPDGKILMGATVDGGSEEPAKRDIAIARANSNGTADMSFFSDSNDAPVVKNNPGAPIQYDYDGVEDTLNDLRIQADGRILVAGRLMGMFGLTRLEGKDMDTEPSSFRSQIKKGISASTYVFPKAITVSSLGSGVSVPIKITCLGVGQDGVPRPWNGCEWKKGTQGYVKYMGWVTNKDVISIQLKFGTYKEVRATVEIGGVTSPDNNQFIQGSVKKGSFIVTRK